MVDKKTIKKFMSVMGLKIYITPFYSDKSICVHLKVRREENLEYYVEDCYKINPDGKLEHSNEEINVEANDGVFGFFNDTESIDNFFLDISEKFAQDFIDQKTKSK